MNFDSFPNSILKNEGEIPWDEKLVMWLNDDPLPKN
jgi:hypothetical protein